MIILTNCRNFFFFFYLILQSTTSMDNNMKSIYETGKVAREAGMYMTQPTLS